MTHAVLTRIVLWFGSSAFVLAIGAVLKNYGEKCYKDNIITFGFIFIVIAIVSLFVWAISMPSFSLHEQQAIYYYNLKEKEDDIVYYINDNLEVKRKDAYQKELDKITKKINREEKYMSMKDWLEYDDLKESKEND